MRSLVPEETSDEKYERSKIEGYIQQYHNERRIKRIQYCSDGYNWENNVSISLKNLIFIFLPLLSFLRMALEQEYKLSPTSPAFLLVTLFTNTTRKDTRNIRRINASLITSHLCPGGQGEELDVVDEVQEVWNNLRCQ